MSALDVLVVHQCRAFTNSNVYLWKSVFGPNLTLKNATPRFQTARNGEGYP